MLKVNRKEEFIGEVGDASLILEEDDDEGQDDAVVDAVVYMDMEEGKITAGLIIITAIVME